MDKALCIARAVIAPPALSARDLTVIPLLLNFACVATIKSVLVDLSVASLAFQLALGWFLRHWRQLERMWVALYTSNQVARCLAWEKVKCAARWRENPWQLACPYASLGRID